MNENNPVVIVFAVLLIAILACGYGASALLEGVSNANTARIAEANERAAQARAIEAQARVDYETAAGERAILDAAAAAVEQGNQALAADRREAHGEPLWLYVLGGFAAGTVVKNLDVAAWLRRQWRARIVGQTTQRPAYVDDGLPPTGDLSSAGGEL